MEPMKRAIRCGITKTTASCSPTSCSSSKHTERPGWTRRALIPMTPQNRIVEILRQIAGKPIDPSPEESLFESGLLDSFSLADLVAALEREFSVQIPDADLK